MHVPGTRPCHPSWLQSFKLLPGISSRGPKVRYLLLHTCSKFTYLYKIGGGRTRSAPNEDSEPKEPQFGDSSGPFLAHFSIYSNAAEGEDNEMVKRWQEDATGILIFVSHSVRIYIV